MAVLMDPVGLPFAYAPPGRRNDRVEFAGPNPSFIQSVYMVTYG